MCWKRIICRDQLYRVRPISGPVRVKLQPLVESITGCLSLHMLSQCMTRCLPSSLYRLARNVTPVYQHPRGRCAKTVSVEPVRMSPSIPRLLVHAFGKIRVCWVRTLHGYWNGDGWIDKRSESIVNDGGCFRPCEC